MTLATPDSWALHVADLDEPTRARVVANTEAGDALRSVVLRAFVSSVRTDLVMRRGAWTGETRTVVRYRRDQERAGEDVVAVLSRLSDAEVTHTSGRVAAVRASGRIRCGCQGINTHTRNRNAGCPSDWQAVRLLPQWSAAGGAYYDPMAEPKPLVWDCAACGAFSRSIPLSAGFARVQADYEDHRANRCPGPDSPIAWKLSRAWEASQAATRKEVADA